MAAKEEEESEEEEEEEEEGAAVAAQKKKEMAAGKTWATVCCHRLETSLRLTSIGRDGAATASLSSSSASSASSSSSSSASASSSSSASLSPFEAASSGEEINNDKKNRVVDRWKSPRGFFSFSILVPTVPGACVMGGFIFFYVISSRFMSFHVSLSLYRFFIRGRAS